MANLTKSSNLNSSSHSWESYFGIPIRHYFVIFSRQDKKEAKPGHIGPPTAAWHEHNLGDYFDSIFSRIIVKMLQIPSHGQKVVNSIVEAVKIDKQNFCSTFMGAKFTYSQASQIGRRTRTEGRVGSLYGLAWTGTNNRQRLASGMR